ncbi:hypothetical protein [Brevundimonas sp.]|uniref:hypothetical protein n=1 Tax=Brevundimonas sp. TaxID=1871086 RepID=UPI0025D7C418|nr:hypothetical protein [Brevundimonas sp.]
MADDIKKKRLNRRSFMATVLGGVAATGATTLIAGEAQAQQRPTGRSDSDSGSYADRANYGRTGITDSDPYDGVGRGIGSGGGGASGLTDSDPVDRGGNGRGNGTGVTDSDSGSGSDPAGRGYSGITESDSGSNRDRAGHGRGRPRG